MIRDVVTYIKHARKKTVTAMGVVYALKRTGRTLYGFGCCVLMGVSWFFWITVSYCLVLVAVFVLVNLV